MLAINPRTVLSAFLLCLSFGTMSNFAAAQAGTNGDLSAPDSSSSSENNTVVRWDRIVGVITSEGLSNPVAGIASSTTPWTATFGAAKVDLTNGAASFFVQGLAFVGGDTIGTPGAVNSVAGALVCDAGAADQVITETPAVFLDVQGNAEFKGRLEKLPPSACSNPIFLILNAPKNIWIATAAVRSFQTAR